MSISSRLEVGCRQAQHSYQVLAISSGTDPVAVGPKGTGLEGC